MSPVRRAFVILLVAAGVVAIFLMLAQDQVTLRIRSAVGAAEPRHANYLGGLLGAQLTRGNRYTVLTNGDQIFPAMLQAIREAKRRVSFETYIYTTGEMGEAFTRAFEEAARRGVRVNLVIDAVGGSGIEEAHVKRLESAGCRLATFNKPSWYSLEEINYRTHRKLLVVDGLTAFTGGVGIDDQWKGNAQDKEHWRDTMVQVAGPVARLMEGAFYENFAEAASEVTPELDDTAAGTDEEGAAFIVRSSPSGGANDLKRLYLLGLGSARQSVAITTPYFVTDESSRWALQDARGARREDPPAARGGHHRRDAGEVRVAQALRTADGARHRDLRVPADDAAYQDLRGRRRVEHVRVGELRQPVAGVERRAQCRGEQPRAGRAADDGLREGPRRLAPPRPRDLAQPLAAVEGARTLLVGVRRGVLGR